MADRQTPQLELSGITKAYPGTLANDNVDLTVLPGEIHALLGENGAGKSTLVKIIYGVVKADAGEMRWLGDRVTVNNPSEARALGIGMVFQHFNLFETLTVAENISLGLDEPHDIKTLSGEIITISERYGLPLNPARHVHALSVAERQRVEIIRCLVQNPKLLIMDEPTSVLTPQEVDSLFGTLRQLSKEGCSILYISHKLDEIQSLCDAATVLRMGKVTARCTPARETPRSLAEMMIGSALPTCKRASRAGKSETVFSLNGLSMVSSDPHGTDLKDITLELGRGEIVAIAGVTGNGQKEFLCALNGEQATADARMIEMLGEPIGKLGPKDRRMRGMAFVPEERLGRGAVPEMSLAMNALLTGYLRNLVRRGFTRTGHIRSFARDIREAFKVKAPDIDVEAKSLSGGNLQKFIIGREIMLDPKVLVLGFPTWGVDVGAAAAIHQAIIDLAARGTAILIVSEDLDELFEICDRIAVIAEGRLSPSKSTRTTNIEEVGMWMSGAFETGGHAHAS